MPVIYSGEPPVTIHIEPQPIVTVHVDGQPTIEVSHVPGVGPPGATGPPGHSYLALSIPGVLAEAVGDIPITATRNTTIFGMWASCGEVPLGADAIFDVRIEGVSIFTTPANRPRVPAGTNADTTLRIPDVTVWLAGQQMTVDVIQVGSTFPGARATLMVDCQ